MTRMILFALAAALAVAACGRQEQGSGKAAPAARDASAHIHSGSGTVQSLSGDKVAIAHGPIAGIGWPAMTMTFTAPPGVASGVKAGDQVGFSFRKDGSAYVLTSLKRRS